MSLLPIFFLILPTKADVVKPLIEKHIKVFKLYPDTLSPTGEVDQFYEFDRIEKMEGLTPDDARAVTG